MDGFFAGLMFVSIFSMGSCVGLDLGKAISKENFIREHKESPYCMNSSATVLDKTVTIKRCFIAKELKLLEK